MAFLFLVQALMKALPLASCKTHSIPQINPLSISLLLKLPEVTSLTELSQFL